MVPALFLGIFLQVEGQGPTFLSPTSFGIDSAILNGVFNERSRIVKGKTIKTKNKKGGLIC